MIAAPPLYVLITPARNEEANIERIIQSVASQTVLPVRWVIVNDGSTDKTPAIVDRYRAEHPWIDRIDMPAHQDRNFAAKAHCCNRGAESVRHLEFGVLGSVDADVSFEPDYMEFLLSKFREDRDLGVAGTPFFEEGYHSGRDSFEGKNHVAGGCQLFRRACFEEMGGYVPNSEGGVDWIAVMTARMNGWRTRSFREKNFFHHRSLGTAERGVLASNFSYGEKDYYLGNHPVWEVFRFAFRSIKRPFIVGGLALATGYLWAAGRRVPRAVSPELMRFHRRAQMEKLKAILVAAARFQTYERYTELESRRSNPTSGSCVSSGCSPKETGRMKYVLITAARNEEALIEHTLRSVMAQTVLPQRWVIIDDGSTDRTATIVSRYAQQFPWIELVSQPPRTERSFAGKAEAVNRAFAGFQPADAEIVANIDADVSFDPDYVEFLLDKFRTDPELGVAGTPFTQSEDYDSASQSFEGENYVAGPFQLFRYRCFRDIGGYVPNAAGGLDWMAVMTARMRGWKVHCFPEKRFHHHRSMGTAQRGEIAALFTYGEKDYYLGGSPLWQMFRVGYRMAKKPYVVGGLALFGGYTWAALRRMHRPVSPELMAFHRQDQMRKLKAIGRKLIRFQRVDAFSPDSEGLRFK